MTRSTLFSRNHPTLLLIKKRRLTDATGDLLLKKLRNIHKKTHVLKSHLNKAADRKTCNFIKKRLQHRCFPVNITKFLKNWFWRTSAYACFWRDFRKWLIRTFFLESRFQNRLSNITKIPVAFKPEPSLNLTSTLYFELRFPMFIINGFDRRANACSPWNSCSFLFYSIF